MLATLFSHLREVSIAKVENRQRQEKTGQEACNVALRNGCSYALGRSPGFRAIASIAFPCCKHSGFLINTTRLPLRGQRWFFTSFPIILE